jgi:hypothetical protein
VPTTTVTVTVTDGPLKHSQKERKKFKKMKKGG